MKTMHPTGPTKEPKHSFSDPLWEEAFEQAWAKDEEAIKRLAKL